MIGEIGYPGDAYTIDCADEPAACRAVLWLGNGAYGITLQNGEELLPSFFAFNTKMRVWFVERFSEELTDFVSGERRVNVATALESIEPGNFVDRADLAGELARFSEDQREAHREEWRRRRRWSSHDIGALAVQMAAQLRATDGPVLRKDG